MKRCPQCNRAERDDALTFCRVDGTPLVRESGAVSDSEGTLRFGSAPVVAGETETRILPPAGAASTTDEAITRPTTPTMVLDAQRTTGGTQPLGKVKWRRAGMIAVAAIIAVALSATAYLYLSRGKSTSTINSIAVLPFVNVGADLNMEYLSDGLSESVIDRLSQLPQLKVIARSSSFKYRGESSESRQNSVASRSARPEIHDTASVCERRTRKINPPTCAMRFCNCVDKSVLGQAQA